MSDAQSTTTDDEYEYRAQVWATTEFTPRVSADSVDEAEAEAREAVRHEHSLAGDGISSVSHEADLGDGEHQVQVWAQQEHIFDVTASSRSEAKEEAKERARHLGIVDSDIDTIQLDGPGHDTATEECDHAHAGSPHVHCDGCGDPVFVGEKRMKRYQENEDTKIWCGSCAGDDDE